MQKVITPAIEWDEGVARGGTTRALLAVFKDLNTVDKKWDTLAASDNMCYVGKRLEREWTCRSIYIISSLTVVSNFNVWGWLAMSVLVSPTCMGNLSAHSLTALLKIWQMTH